MQRRFRRTYPVCGRPDLKNISTHRYHLQVHGLSSEERKPYLNQAKVSSRKLRVSLRVQFAHLSKAHEIGCSLVISFLFYSYRLYAYAIRLTITVTNKYLDVTVFLFLFYDIAAFLFCKCLLYPVLFLVVIVPFCDEICISCSFIFLLDTFDWCIFCHVIFVIFCRAISS